MIRSRTFGFKIAVGFAISFAMLLVVGTVGYVSISRLWNNTDELGVSYAVIDRLSELISVMKDAETGQRGYLLTGDDAYLEPYKVADSSIYNVVKQLRDLIANNPNQGRRLDQALRLIQSKMAELKQTIDLRRSQGFDAAVKLVATNRGKIIMDMISIL